MPRAQVLSSVYAQKPGSTTDPKSSLTNLNDSKFMTRYIIEQEVRHTLEIKKSQFITWLRAVDDREQAMAFLDEAKQAYPDARHHCWAYVMGHSANSQTAAMSDDGEPSGTAGKPMLNVLQHKPVNNVMVIVIRYFGGIKLGAGGLVRAYSQAVEQAFGKAELQPIVEKSALRVFTDFANEQWLRHQVKLVSGNIENIQYGQDVEIQVLIPKEECGSFYAALNARGVTFNIKE